MDNAPRGGMDVACYVGTHAGDTPLVRLGWALTRASQKGEHSDVTHSEAILAWHADGSADIASATMRPETEAGTDGVRIKERVMLTPGNWLIVNMPMWDVAKSREWFIAHKGKRYDRRGALVNPTPLWWSNPDRYFCHQAVGLSQGVISPEVFTCAAWACMLVTFGKIVRAK